MVLIRNLVLISMAVALPCPVRAQADSLAAARRIAASASLAAKEYALGVAPQGRRVTLVQEVEEAGLFLDQARFDVPALPVGVRAYADSALVALRDLVNRRAPPAEVEDRAAALVRRLGVGYAFPARLPSLARGAEVYAEQCAACHGDAGRGDGPKAMTLEGPPPANLADAEAMRDVPAVDVFRRVTLGVPGTAMPEFESTLSEEDRWALTAYVATLHGGSPASATFEAIRRQVDSAVATRSDRLAFEAYLTFEQVETDVRAKRPGLAAELEAHFAALRTGAPAADAAELEAIRRRLLGALERAERVVADRPAAGRMFVSSLLLLVREGFEAILVIATLMTFLSKAGVPDRRRDVGRGAWLAVLASVATWALVEWLFQITPGQQETLEGATLLLATAVLFYVSYWLVSRAEGARWVAFVRGRMESALSSGSGLALAGVAFLAVYREGFETILFYKALLTSGGSGATAAVLGGAVAGAAALVVFYVAVSRVGLRLPLRPFFAATSAFLYVMAFVFAGKGIAALQAAGLVPLSYVPSAPRVPEIGVYPTVESLMLQGALIALAVFALVRRRLRPSAFSSQQSAASGAAKERGGVTAPSSGGADTGLPTR